MNLNNRILGQQPQLQPSDNNHQNTFVTTDGYILVTPVDISSGQSATSELSPTPYWLTSDQQVDNYVTTPHLRSPDDSGFNARNGAGDTFKKTMEYGDGVGQLSDYHPNTAQNQQQPRSQASLDAYWVMGMGNNGQLPSQHFMETSTESYNNMQQGNTEDNGDCSLLSLNGVPTQGPSNLTPSSPIKPVRKTKWGDSLGSSKRKSTCRVRYIPVDEDDKSGDQNQRKKNQSPRIRKDSFSNPTSPESSPSSSDEALNDNRISHNLVEKQYRTRMNEQFDNLFSSIPPKMIGQHINGPQRGDRPEKRVSKADVLTLAKMYIEILEQEKRELELENMGLKENKRLNEVWMSQQGGEMLFYGNGH